MLGSFTFIIPAIFLRVLISFILKIIIILTGNINVVKAYKRVMDELFFKIFISTSIEGLFSLVIISYLNIRTLVFDSFGEKLGAGLSLYCLIF
jgi:hypothetical protein